MIYDNGEMALGTVKDMTMEWAILWTGGYLNIK